MLGYTSSGGVENVHWDTQNVPAFSIKITKSLCIGMLLFMYDFFKHSSRGLNDIYLLLMLHFIRWDILHEVDTSELLNLLEVWHFSLSPFFVDYLAADVLVHQAIVEQ